MQIEDVIVLGLRTLLIAVVPVTIAVALAGTIMAAIQSATALHDSAASFAIRLLAAAVALYVIFPIFTQSLMSLTEVVFR